MAEKGSPIEKIKLEKDGTTAFVDVYEYARKIREGEMTWEDLDKADLESVRSYCIALFMLHVFNMYLIDMDASFHFTHLSLSFLFFFRSA